MKTYPIFDECGEQLAFEIESAYTNPRMVSEVLRGVDGVSNISVRSPFSKETEELISFTLDSVDFLVWEPYGDSSRYWIGPTDDIAQDPGNVGLVEGAFQSYQPPIAYRVIGDFLSLKFLKIQWRAWRR